MFDLRADPHETENRTKVVAPTPPGRKSAVPCQDTVYGRQARGITMPDPVHPEHILMINRRRFLQLVSVATGAALVGGCTGGDDATTSTTGAGGANSVPRPTTTPPAASVSTVPTTAGELWWAGLEEMLAALRSSPDHFQSRYDAAVAAGDVDGLVDLAKALQPMWALPNVDRPLWGCRGTLRSGFGSPRDVADVLRDGLVEMGRDASVVALRDEAVVAASLGYLAPPQEFDPGDTVAIAERMGLTIDDTPLEPLDATATETLADQLLDLALDGDRFEVVIPPEPEVIRSLPAVVLVGGDESTRLDLWSETGHQPWDRSASHSEGRATPDTTVTLLATFSGDLRRPVPVASGTWSWAELVGRRVHVALAPTAPDLLTMLNARPASATSWLPTVQLAGLDLVAGPDGVDVTELGNPTMFVGNAITVAGSIIDIGADPIEGDDTADADDTVSEINLSDPRTRLVGGDGDPDSVATVDVSRASVFASELTVVAIPRTSDGIAVGDLPGTAITLTDFDGARLPASIEQSTAPAPRVSLVVDVSNSIDETFLDGLERLVTELLTDLQARHPDALMRIIPVGGNSNRSFTNDIDDLTQVLSYGFGSDIYEALADAASLATAIVLISDADPTDGVDEDPMRIPPEYRRKIEGGAPIITLLAPAETQRLDVAEQLADLTGGAVTSAASTDEAIAEISARLDVEVPPLRLVARMPTGGPNPRRLELTIGSAPPVPFDVESDVPEEGAVSDGLVGIHVQVSSGNIDAFRTLAGVAPTDRRDPTPDDQLQIQRVSAGSFRILFEPEAPTVSAVLLDLLTDHAERRHIFDAPDAATALNAAAERLNLIGRDFDLSGPLPRSVDQPLTHGVMPRCTFVTRQRIVIDGTEVAATGIDLMDCNGWDTYAPDLVPLERARWTARRSLHLSLVEARNYDDSAASRLADADLTVLTASSATPDGADPQAWSRLTGSRRQAVFLGDAADPLSAAWAVGAGGQIVGVRGDGAGYGQSVAEIERVFNQIIRWLEVAEELGGGSIMGAFAGLERAKLQVLKKCTIAIATMTPPDDGGLGGPACEGAARHGGRLGDDAIGNVGGVVGRIARGVSRINAVSTAVGTPNIPTPGSEIGGACD